MNILVVGGGAREHALVRALALGPSAERVHALPGNPGLESMAQRHNISLQDHQGISDLCQSEGIDLVVIGPENPLVEGLSDFLRREGISVFGPSQYAAQLEGSKTFAKEFMVRNGIPTADFDGVASVADVEAVMEKYQPPYVLKADGLAGGKGVFICPTKEELLAACHSLFVDKRFGAAGAKAILEQFQPGYELSFFILTNGVDFEPLPLAQDHKRLLDGDEGPNTGGMGAIAPIAIAETLREQILSRVVRPTVEGFAKESIDYRGVVFIGLMITDSGPQVIEYNVRFGDPETQVLLPLLEGDWAEHLMSIAQGEMPRLDWKDGFCASVVLAAEGYPAKPVKGAIITGDLEPEKGYFLHAATDVDGELWKTAGGRVLNAVGEGASLDQALKQSYEIVQNVAWPGMQHRRDIGKQFYQE